MRYAVIALLILPVLAAAGGWRSDVVMSGYSVMLNGYTSLDLELDANDIPHMCSLYWNDRAAFTCRIVYYMYWNGSSWEVETIYSLYWEDPHESHIVDLANMVLDSNDNPILSWHADGGIYYYHLGETYPVYTGQVRTPRICVDSSDSAHFCLLESESSLYYLQYLYYEDSEWKCQTITSVSDPGVLDFALDSSDNPRFVFEDEDAEVLYYIYWGGSSWVSEPIDSGEFHDVSFLLDTNDNPKLIYDIDGNALIYAYKESATWHYETIDSDVDIAECELVLTSDRFPRVTYSVYGEYLGFIKYACRDGADWTIQTVAEEDYYDFHSPSIALDSNDEPRIIFSYDSEEIGIKYAWYDDYIFHLVWPENEETVSTTTPTLDWEDCTIPGHESYTLWWSEDSDFSTYNEVTGIASSEYQITAGIEDGDRIYWRVKSVTAGDEHWAEEMDWYFYVDLSTFHLLEPENGAVVDTLTPALDWGDSPFPGHESYTLWWGEDPDFETYNEVTDITESGYTIRSGIEDGDRIYWRVKSIDEFGGEYWAAEMDWYFYVELGVGVTLADLGARSTDEGVLVDWRLEGGEAAGVRILRGSGEPTVISGNLPGGATRYLDRDVEPGGSYTYWLEVVDAEGTVERFGPTAAVTVPIETLMLVLDATYPSPAWDAVTIAYSVPEDGRVVLSVYDLSGRRVATLVDVEMTAGRHEVAWNCADVPSGVYLYRLESAAGALTRRLIISR